MKSILKTALPLIAISMYTACSLERELQADFVEAELVKIDTVYRYTANEVVLTFKCRNRAEFVSFVPLESAYKVGSVYKVLLVK
jgi:hypothetical protein